MNCAWVKEPDAGMSNPKNTDDFVHKTASAILFLTNDFAGKTLRAKGLYAIIKRKHCEKDSRL